MSICLKTNVSCNLEKKSYKVSRCVEGQQDFALCSHEKKTSFVLFLQILAIGKSTFVIICLDVVNVKESSISIVNEIDQENNKPG